jgi:type I restriction enzyme R subunit
LRLGSLLEPDAYKPNPGKAFRASRSFSGATLQQQAQNNSLARFSASPDLQNEFVGAVIGAMDSSAELSTQILNSSEISQKLLGELVPIVYRALKETA